MHAESKTWLAANRSLWNTWTRRHAQSDFYDVAGFRAGACSLKAPELEELGEVSGRSLLHLQCHFGLDTLSWARRGARVTGVDFSPEAIRLARSIGAELGIEAEFLCADVYALPQVLPAEFDIVFTSYGVLCWLPDLDGWARVIAHFLKPGGAFYMVEFHPLLDVLDESGTRMLHPYFPAEAPIELQPGGPAAGAEEQLPPTVYAWSHSLGEVVTALIGAGLRIEFLHEFPYSVYPHAPFLVAETPGRYVLKDRLHALPLMFSIKASRAEVPTP